MALTDEGNSGIPATMLVGPANFAGAGMGQPYPVYMNGGQQSGSGNGWDNGWWIILLFILLASGNWGGQNNGQGGFIGGGNGGGVGNLYPWMNQAEITTNGFQNQLLNDNVTSIRDGIGNLSTQLCNCCCDMRDTVNQGFYGTQAALNAGFNNAETAANARQMANMQTAFAGQTAMAQGFNQLSSQFADCCCENRLASADLKYTIATENCADRYEAAQNTRDIIESQTRGTQSILDKLCQLELDGKNDRIADLERQLTFANLQASQIAQTAEIQRGQVAEVDALYNRLATCPVPTEPVYGRQPIFTCPQQVNNCGCGCGCGNNF